MREWSREKKKDKELLCIVGYCRGTRGGAYRLSN